MKKEKKKKKNYHMLLIANRKTILMLCTVVEMNVERERARARAPHGSHLAYNIFLYVSVCGMPVWSIGVRKSNKF